MIKSELKKPGALTIGELYIPGTFFSAKKRFLSAYVYHPSMANNELSGPSVATFLAKYLLKRQNQYSIRIVWAPETIGANCTYLSKRKRELKNNVFAAFNLTCVGDDNNWSQFTKNSRKEIRLQIKLLHSFCVSVGSVIRNIVFYKPEVVMNVGTVLFPIDLPMVSISRVQNMACTKKP